MGVGKVRRIQMYTPQIRNDCAALRYVHPLVHKVLRACVRGPAQDGDWPPPQCLVHDRADVREVVVVLERRQTVVAYDRVKLLLCLGDEGGSESGAREHE